MSERSSAAACAIAQRLFKHAVAAVDPRLATAASVSVVNHDLYVNGRVVQRDLTRFDSCVVVGAGKASAEMGLGLLEALGRASDFRLPIKGLIITKYDHSKLAKEPLRLAGIELIEAAHPVPDSAGESATRKLVDLLKATSSVKTLVFWLASGGGSALTPLPVTDKISLSEIQATVKWLLSSGAPIDQVNTIRKHLCLAQGGRSALMAHPSTVVTLAVSDVIGDSLSTIAGGPTTADTTTLTDFFYILDSYKSSSPPLDFGKLSIPETPKSLSQNILPGIVVCGLSHALKAARELAREESLNCLVLTGQLQGEAKEVAKVVASIAKDSPVERPFVILCGGETTVSLPSNNSGVGGRNQELALAAGLEIAGESQIVAILSAGTDGTDGPTDYAGAVFSNSSLSSLDLKTSARTFLSRHDSATFLKKFASDCIVQTGPTGTNVGDLVILVGL